MTHTTRLTTERLEDRSVPTLFGNPWPDPGHLTFSFAPDGTDVAGVQSHLGMTLGGLGTALWQREIARAFQTWAMVANLNFAAVSDNGGDFGEPGPVQGSEWYGDIRIAARPLSDGELAVATPFNMFSNWAGEIVLNSDKLFAVGTLAGRYDLYTVMLQEIGHALGLDNSPDTAAAMYTVYSSTRAGLAASDVAAIQTLYGARSPDRFDASGANDTSAKADTLSFVTDATKQLGSTDGTAGPKPFVAAGDITTLSDVDYYVYTTPKGSSSFTVSLLTSGLSQLNAKVAVYDASGKLLATALATPPAFGKPFELFVGNAKDKSTYRIKVEGATKDVFGVGQYKLAVGDQSQEAVVKRVEATFFTPTGEKDADDHDDTYQPSALLSFVDLGVARPKDDARWDFTGFADVSQPGDSDVYRVQTKADTPPVLVISAWDTFGGKLDPTVRVYDATGRTVKYEVLQNDRGTFTIQVVGVKPNTSYYIRIYAENPFDSNSNTGKYFLGIDFRDDGITHTTFAAGTLQGGAQNQAFTSFQLTRTQAVWFELSGSVNPDVASRLTVYDASGNGVFTLKSVGGQVVGGGVFLSPGVYTVRIVAAAQSGPLLAYSFRARYSLESDPIGPEPITDPAPVGSPNPAPTTPVLYAPDPTTGTLVPITDVNWVYMPPVGIPGAKYPIDWVTDPPTLLYLSTFGDIYSNPWLW